ncbi:hypothetical protein ABT025_18495 [Streptomyces sp. NPDC002809]|uniref:hypothetical protein n=1 Tax=Streptomyces sp. NPDC002809 TaxID=3154433 RepID=UPI00332A962F
MNARDELYAFATAAFKDAGVPPLVDELLNKLLDNTRSESIAERDAQIIAWLKKKAGEEGTSNKESRARSAAIGRMADKLSRGAVRPPLSSDAIRNKLRAEGLAEAADAVADLLKDTPEYGEFVADFLRRRAREAADQ